MNPTQRFRGETVEACPPPRGIAQGEWCRYVIASEDTRVVGRYRGSLRQAARNAETLASDINRRAESGSSPWTPRGRRRTQQVRKT
jgi:hypothetical protein